MTLVRKHHEIDAVAKAIADWRSMAIVHVIYEHGPLRYRDVSAMLDFSPTVLSGKLAQLTKLGVINRRHIPGTKEVMYTHLPVAVYMVNAYHLLEEADTLLAARKNQHEPNE